MRKSLVSFKHVALVAALACSAAALTLTDARTRPAAGITVVNNSTREIRHLYLSPTDQDAWGADQLNDSVIHTGESATISASCNGGIKVIAEDADGCFMSTVVSCDDNATWTITNDTPADCGN